MTELLNAKFQDETTKPLTHFPNGLCLIRGELWCCQDDGIGVYDLHLNALRTISRDEMGHVYGAADTGDGMVVATHKGLYAMSYSGISNI